MDQTTTGNQLIEKIIDRFIDNENDQQLQPRLHVCFVNGHKLSFKVTCWVCFNNLHLYVLHNDENLCIIMIYVD